MSKSAIVSFLSLLGIAFTLGVFVAPVLLGQQDITPNNIAITIALVFLLSKVDDALSSYFESEDAQKSYLSQEELRKSVQAITNLRFVGNSSEAVEELFGRLQYASRVRNTYVVTTSLFHKEYPRDVMTRSFPAMIEFLKREDTVWEDVIGGRINSYYARITGVTKHSKNNNFRVHKLKFDGPIINFTILEYPKSSGRANEVYFGWGHHDVNPSGEVYVSSDQGVVALFAEQFQTLQTFGELMDLSELTKEGKNVLRMLHKPEPQMIENSSSSK